MKRVTKYIGIGLSVVLAGTLGLVAWRGQEIADWIELRDYVPQENIARLADNTAMSDKARRIFYVHDPIVEPRSNFDHLCHSAESTIVLGCYTGNRIYIAEVSDERLNGVNEVTAAHEMLHAAYHRLNSREKARIDGLTQREASTIKDERLQTIIKNYRARDPSIVANELHSILGTEVRDLEPELEEYYRQYFNDRTAVVAISERYEQVFVEKRNNIEKLDSELVLSKAEVDQLEADLKERGRQLDVERTEIERQQQNPTNESYAMAVSFNNKIEVFNNDIARYRSLIAAYNQKVEQRNELAKELNGLYSSLDSKVPSLESL